MCRLWRGIVNHLRWFKQGIETVSLTRNKSSHGRFECKSWEGSISGHCRVVWIGYKNDRGDIWLEWCNKHDQIIASTLFCQHTRRLWTWKDPVDNIRNQTDYIIRNSITKVKGYPGADCNSDHVLVVCWFLLRLKKLTRPKQKPKLDFKQLHNETVRVEFASEAANLIGERITTNSDIQDNYTNLHEA